MKSTVVYYGLTFLLINILLNHFVGDIARADCQISSGPKMSAPELLAQMRKLRQQNPRAYAFQPLHNLAYVLRWTIRDEHVNMVAGYLTRDNFNLMLNHNLPQDIPGANCHLTRQYPLAVFGNPNNVYFEIRFGMCSKLITSHSDSV